MAVGRADRGLAELAEQAEQLREALGPEVLVHERHVGREPGQVRARREHAIVGRRQHHAAHRIVVARRLQRCDQIAEQLVGQRVAGVRLVERDRRDAGAGYVVAKGGVGHARTVTYQAVSRKSYCSLWRDREMATADVLKPDFASQRKHFIFTDEHEQLRESIRRFVIKELQPHADEWEETTFPDWVFERMGELGFLGTRQARGVRRPGRRLLHGARARRGDRARALRRPRDGSRGPDRHGDAADPGVRHRGAEAGVGRARDRRQEDPRDSASPSPTPAPTSPESRRGRSRTATST